MASPQPDKFVRLSNELLEALLHARLSGVQLRIVLWVIRHTYGWNRKTVAFSWYRIARELGVDRGGTVRSGHALLKSSVLSASEGRIEIQKDYDRWDRAVLGSAGDGGRQLWMPGVIDDSSHRKTMTGVIASDDKRHRDRGQASSLFRRAKDRGKDRLKTDKDTQSGESDDKRHRSAKPETPLQQVMNHYIAMKGEKLSKEQTSAFYSRFGRAAKSLLEACSGNAEEAKAAITKIGGRLNEQSLSWTLETICKWHCDPSLLKGGENSDGRHPAGAAKPIPGKYAGLSGS